MAAMQRILRLLKIVSLLQLGQPVNARTLAEVCEVSKRTIFRDIQNLRDSGLRLHYDEDQQTYTFDDARFLLPADLTADEALALIVLSQEVADSRSGIAHLEPARTAAFKLASVLPRPIRESVHELLATHRISLGPHAPLKETEDLFQTLRQALAMRVAVEIEYGAYTEQGLVKTRLHPYSFYYGTRSWYVIGWSSKHRQVRTFHLKRFLKVKLLKSRRYRIPARFSLESYFGNAWRMIRNKAEAYHVVIRFAPLVAGNVADVQWHPTQRIEEHEDGSIDFHADIEGLSEISWWVLGYGDQAEVLEPEALRKVIVERVRKMLRLYGGRKK